MKLIGGLAYVTADEMRQVDQAAVREFGVDVLHLMERAGFVTALMAKEMLGGSVEGKRVRVLSGKGNNGGDGLVAAQRLAEWGAVVSVSLGAEREDLGDAPSARLLELDRMGMEIRQGWQQADTDLVVDALLGYSAKGNPREPLASMIRAADSSSLPILAIDLPSGLDPTSGLPGEPCIRARSTVTLGFPKVGFLNPESASYVGGLFLGDISLPAELYERYSTAPYPFARGPLRRLK